MQHLCLLIHERKLQLISCQSALGNSSSKSELLILRFASCASERFLLHAAVPPHTLIKQWAKQFLDFFHLSPK